MDFPFSISATLLFYAYYLFSKFEKKNPALNYFFSGRLLILTNLRIEHPEDSVGMEGLLGWASTGILKLTNDEDLAFTGLRTIRFMTDCNI